MVHPLKNLSQHNDNEVDIWFPKEYILKLEFGSKCKSPKIKLWEAGTTRARKTNEECLAKKGKVRISESTYTQIHRN